MRALPLLLPLLFLACGYRTGQVAGGEGITVAIPVFTNRTYRRGLERDLTRAVHEELRNRSRFALVEESRNPDLLVEGDLVRAGESVISQETGGVIRETSVLLSVVVAIEDRRVDPPARRLRSFVESRAIVPGKGDSIRTAELAAIRTIAEKIVYALGGEW